MTDVVVCVDGLAPAYLEAHHTPRWEEIGRDGANGRCDGVVPSLTNVNNVSIATARFPHRHGITGNTYYDRDADEFVYMESPAFLRWETQLRKRASNGETVAVLVAKRKLERMIGGGCDVVASAEDPPTWLEDAVGEAPGIYSGDASAWLLDAAVHVVDEVEPDLLYVSTTDVVPHKHGPHEAEAGEWVRAVDSGIGALRDRGCAIVATADHGMNHKSVCIDVERLLRDEGVPAEVVRLIRDEHTYHHQNLGGVAYAYLDEHAPEDVSWLADVDGVDEVLSAEEAAERFQLPTDRIGDATILGASDAVFGPVDDGIREPVDLRSHGSVHERRVPYVSSRPATLEYNTDAFDALR